MLLERLRILLLSLLLLQTCDVGCLVKILSGVPRTTWTGVDAIFGSTSRLRLRLRRLRRLRRRLRRMIAQRLTIIAMELYGTRHRATGCERNSILANCRLWCSMASLLPLVT